ncbi:ATPase, partial [Vibrio cholerae]
MSLFAYKDDQALGKVASVDTSTVVIEVEDREFLKRLQVNRLAVLQSAKPGQHLIGLISQVTRKKIFEITENEEEVNEQNLCKVALIGTLLDRDGERRDVFRRTLESVPEID